MNLFEILDDFDDSVGDELHVKERLHATEIIITL